MTPNENPTDEQLADACMWLRHDFGLLDEQARRTEMSSMREHWRAIWKACNTPGRGGQYVPAPNNLECLRIAAGIELEDSFESGSKWCVGDDELAKLVQLAKAAARADPAKILRLEWVAADEGFDNLYEAKTPIGLYELCTMPKGVQAIFQRTPDTYRRLGERTGMTMEQAKLLAQSDFDAQVLSCLAG